MLVAKYCLDPQGADASFSPVPVKKTKITKLSNPELLK